MARTTISYTTARDMLPLSVASLYGIVGYSDPLPDGSRMVRIGTARIVNGDAVSLYPIEREQLVSILTGQTIPATFALSAVGRNRTIVGAIADDTVTVVVRSGSGATRSLSLPVGDWLNLLSDDSK